MKDPTGIASYEHISEAPLSKWTQTFRTPLRRRWALHYLRSLDQDELGTMGYVRDELIRSLTAEEQTWVGTPSDVLGMSRGALVGAVRSRLRGSPYRAW